MTQLACLNYMINKKFVCAGANGYEPGGRRFESFRARHTHKNASLVEAFLYRGVLVLFVGVPETI